MDFELTEEQQALAEMAAGLSRRRAPNPNVAPEQAGEFPWEFAHELADHDLTGIDIPAEKGGQGLSLLDSILVLSAVARTAPHLGDAVQATNFGAIRQVAAFAGERLIADVLAPALAGRALITVGMTEPGGGSALGGLRTRARRTGDTIVVDGSKVFNSQGPEATHCVVWSRFGDETDSIGAVVVPTDTAGFSRGATEHYMSGEAHCTLSFERCEVPAEYMLLKGDGMRRMMPVFNIERLGNAARSHAFGELALRLATEHMLERETGGGRLADYQGLRWKLAEMRLRLDAAGLLLHRAALQLSDGIPDPLNTSLAKLAANEAGFHAANEALQIFGGYGFTEDSPLNYLFKRTRGWMIAGGSVEMQRNRIASEMLRHKTAQSGRGR
ncbi:MAG: acyl-CoA dehydrogenase family protein [Gemmatimonadales bacterium]